MKLDVRMTRKYRLISLAVAGLFASACAPQVSSSLRAPTTEGRVSADAYGNVHILVGGHNYVLKPIDGRAVGNVSIQIGEKAYNTIGGNFQLPESALKEFQSNARGFFRVFAPGYVPKQIWIGQTGDEVPLVPMLAVKLVPDFPSSGGTIKAPEKGIAVTIPAGMLVKPKTSIQISTYTPVAKNDPAAVTASLARRQDFLDKLAHLAGPAKAYQLAQAMGSCANPEAPLPCPPATTGLGVMLTVNGPLQAGVVSSQLDLDFAGQDAASGAAYARILKTFAQIDASANGPAMRDLLASQYGLSLVGHLLTFSVQVGANAVTDGFVRVEVQGLDLLGVNMEFTAVSAIGNALPPGASTPGLIALTSSSPVSLAGSLASTSVPGLAAGQRLISQDGGGLISQDGGGLIGQDGAGLITRHSGLISQDGGSLISQDGAGLISQDGGGLSVATGLGRNALISQDGAGLISQDGGGLITNDGGSLVGHVTAPFAPPGVGKYQLQNYVDFPWPEQAQVRAVTFAGAPISTWVTTNTKSDYSIDHLPPTPAYFFIEAKFGAYVMRSIAKAPGLNGQVVSDVTAATTAVSSAAYVGLLANAANAALLSPARITADVAEAKLLLDQTTAGNTLNMSIAQIATTTWNLFRTASIVPQSFAGGTVGGVVHGALPIVVAAPPTFGTPMWVDPFGVDLSIPTTALAQGTAGSLLLANVTAPNIMSRANLAGLTPITPFSTQFTDTASGVVRPMGKLSAMVDDIAGNTLYAADYTDHVVIKVDAAGVASAIYGDATASVYNAVTNPGGTKGPGGPPIWSEGLLDAPSGVAFDSTNNKLYIADSSWSRIVEVNLTANPNSTPYSNEIVAPNPARGFRQCVMAGGDLFVAVSVENKVIRLHKSGATWTETTFATGVTTPVALAVAPEGYLFIAERPGTGGRISWVPLATGGVATTAVMTVDPIAGITCMPTRTLAYMTTTLGGGINSITY